MLENIIGTLKSQVGDQIVSKTNVPSGKLDSIISVIGNTAKKEIAGQMVKGNLSDVMNLFSNKPNNSGADSMQSGLISGVVSNLTKKLGLSPAVSREVAEIAVPALIGLVTQKNNTTPDDDPSPLNELFGKQGKGNLLGGLAKKFLSR